MLNGRVSTCGESYSSVLQKRVNKQKGTLTFFLKVKISKKVDPGFVCPHTFNIRTDPCDSLIQTDYGQNLDAADPSLMYLTPGQLCYLYMLVTEKNIATSPYAARQRGQRRVNGVGIGGGGGRRTRPRPVT